MTVTALLLIVNVNWKFIFTRESILLSAGLSYRNSVCLSVCHTGGSVKNVWKTQVL